MSKQYKFLFCPPDAIHFTIVPGENLDGFRVLVSELRQHWVPSGPDEEDCVLDMAKANWGKRRCQRFLQARGTDATYDPDHRAYDETAAIEALILTLNRAKQDEEVVEALQRADARVREHLLRTRPRERFATTAKWVKGLRSEIFKRFLFPLMRLGPPPDEVLMHRSTAFLTDEVIAQQLKIEAELDAKFNRALDRLLRIKQAKRQLPFREVRKFYRVAEQEERQSAALSTKEDVNG